MPLSLNEKVSEWLSFLFYSFFMANYTCQTDITFAFAHQNIARRVSKWEMTNTFHILHQDTSQRHPIDLRPFCKKKITFPFFFPSPLPMPYQAPIPAPCLCLFWLPAKDVQARCSRVSGPAVGHLEESLNSTPCVDGTKQRALVTLSNINRTTKMIS